MVEKVIATAAALELVAFLAQKHGAVMFHQSGGCCDGSAANCYLPGDLTIGAYDVVVQQGPGYTTRREEAPSARAASTNRARAPPASRRARRARRAACRPAPAPRTALSRPEHAR